MSESLNAVVKKHQRSRKRSDVCACGEAYPCSTLGLVVEVEWLRRRVWTLETRIGFAFQATVEPTDKEY